MKKESELRNTTIMFADISGFTAMSEKMAPEDVTIIMNSVFSIIGNIVKYYDGRIDKFIGDCVMVTYGAPTAVENAPQKAINGAIEIRNQLYEFNRKKRLTIPLDIHIGINSGNVLAGEVGSDEKKEYTVMGDAVNLASRLEDASKTGQILVGPTTFRHTKDQFSYNELKPIRVKGKAEPISVFELVSEKVKLCRLGPCSNREIQSEIVGRKNEIQKLESIVHKTKKSDGLVVNIIGEAGLGKSRLISEFKTMECLKDCTILEGSALTMGRTLAFYPIIEILKGYASINEDDTTAEQAKKIKEKIEETHPDEAYEIFPFIARLMGIKVSDKTAERVQEIEDDALDKLIYKNLRELIIKEAETNPLVFILEDLHWADTSSIDLISSLFRLAESRKLLFVNVFRPNYEETGDKVLNYLEENYPYLYTNIEIRPLDATYSNQLIDNLLKIDGLPEYIRKQIRNRSEGNPFFIEEVIRSFIDQEILDNKTGHFRFTDKVENALIPDTIQELLMSRIDRLDEDTKILLKSASVIGRSFFYRILMKLEPTMPELDNRLDFLEQVQLIRCRKRLGEAEYLFKHALAQKVTYESILLKNRKELHRQVAQAIEDKFSHHLSEFYGTLAYHYNMADDSDKTEVYMEKAGEEAMKASASSEAIGYYKQLIDIYIPKYGKENEQAKLAEMQKNIAQALLNKGNWREAVVYFDDALKNFGYFESSIKPIQMLKFLNSFIKIAIIIRLKSHISGISPNKRDIQIFEIIRDRALSLVLMDPMRMSLGFFPAAQKIFTLDISKAQALFDIMCIISYGFAWTGISYDLAKRTLGLANNSLKDKEHSISVHLYRIAEGFADMLFGKWDIEIDLKSVDKMITTGDFEAAVGYLCFSGPLALEKGDLPTVNLVADRLEKIREVYNNEHSTTDLLELNVIKSIKLKAYEQAAAYVENGLKHLEKHGHKAYKVSFLGMKLQIEVMTGNSNKAKKTITQVEMLIDKVGMINIAPFFYSRYVIGVLLYHRANLIKSINEKEHRLFKESKKQAQLWCKKALKTAKKIAPILTESLRLTGEISWLINKNEKAFIWYNKSIQEGERLGARLELSRSYLEVGKRLIDYNSKGKKINGITGEKYIEKAQALFEEMGLTSDLEELRIVRTSMSC